MEMGDSSRLGGTSVSLVESGLLEVSFSREEGAGALGLRSSSLLAPGRDCVGSALLSGMMAAVEEVLTPPPRVAASSSELLATGSGSVDDGPDILRSCQSQLQCGAVAV